MNILFLCDIKMDNFTKSLIGENEDLIKENIILYKTIARLSDIIEKNDEEYTVLISNLKLLMIQLNQSVKKNRC